MGFGRAAACASYNTPTVLAARVSQPLGRCFQTPTVPLPGQRRGQAHHKCRIHLRDAAIQLGLLPDKGVSRSSRNSQGQGKACHLFLPPPFFFYEVRLIAWEFADKWSSQQLQEAAALMDSRQEETGAPAVTGTQGSKHQSCDDLGR